MIVLWMLCVVLIMALAVALFYVRKFKRMERRQYENSCVWHNLFMEERENYKALEQGRDEESSDYEQLYISQQEMLVERDGTISMLEIEDQIRFVACRKRVSVQSGPLGRGELSADLVVLEHD